MAKRKSGWKRCSICGAKMKGDKLASHMKRVHPKGATTREERQEITRRRRKTSGLAKVAVIVVIIIVVILVAYFALQGYVPRGSKVGDKPYNFSLETTDGDTYTLDDDLGKKPILIDFSKHDCPHCIKMGYVLHDLYTNYSSELIILTVISDSAAKMSDVKDFQNLHDAQWTHMHDVGGKVFNQYDNYYFPQYYLIDSHEKIHWKEHGELSYNALEEKIKEVL